MTQTRIAMMILILVWAFALPREARTLESAESGAGDSGSSTTTTSNALLKYVDSSGTIGEAALVEEGGTVMMSGSLGIGTAGPQGKAHVLGAGLTSFTGASNGLVAVDYADGVLGRHAALDFRATGTAWGPLARIAMQPTGDGSYLAFGTSSSYGSGITNTSLLINPYGNIGIGTTTPTKRLHVAGDALLGGHTQVTGRAEVRSTGLTAFTGLGNGILSIDYNDSAYRMAALDFRATTSTNNNPAARVGMEVTSWGSYLLFGTSNSYAAGITNTAMAIDPWGNVGIGTPIPLTKLHVAGDVTVAGNIAAKYQDVAEWVEVTTALEAGTVVIVDPVNPNQVITATEAYDTRVAGAVSAQPGLILGDQGDTKEMIAQSGRVRIKADASFGAIRIGDLLVTSSTPGHAMRSEPMRLGDHAMHRPGTLLGKALEALPSGKGEILVLLTLQ